MNYKAPEIPEELLPLINQYDAHVVIPHNRVNLRTNARYLIVPPKALTPTSVFPKNPSNQWLVAECLPADYRYYEKLKTDTLAGALTAIRILVEIT